MRKYIALLLAGLICLGLCGCKSQGVTDTEALIAAIGEVTLEQEAAIAAAEEAYQALEEKDREKVENAALLTDARKAYDNLVQEQLQQERAAQAAAVEALIAAIGQVDRTSEDAIVAAEEAYSLLSEESKALVTTAEDLANARARYDGIFQTVEITLDTWQEYFEITTLDIWHEDASGNLESFEELFVLQVKEAYRGNILLDSLDVSMEFTMDRYRSVWKIDWENRTYEIGDLEGHHFGTGTPIDTVSFVWNQEKEWKDAENHILCGFENAWESRDWGQAEYRLSGTQLVLSYIAGTMTIIND